MKKSLQLKFDPNQDYQLRAISSVVDLFEGFPRRSSGFALGDADAPNLPPGNAISENLLLGNLNQIQERNILALSPALETDDGLVLDGAGSDSWRHPSFTVEMETGTGKTYVYLRTIMELRKHYGFRKFIIIVPSIAIYEGVIKNFEITRSHFGPLYKNEPVNLLRFEGGKLSSLRNFASSSFVEILVMTLQSFNTALGKGRNLIYRSSEQLPGERLPFEFIQATRPILILDEPQNMGSETAKAAIRTLHPLFSLRYSATHRESPNLIYRLTPFEAFSRGLVKRIQVDAVSEEQTHRSNVELQEIKKAPLKAIVRTLVTKRGVTSEASVVLSHGDNLFTKTKREEHRHGYVVTEINAKENFVDFDGQSRLSLGTTFANSKEAVFRVQIQRTVERHMQVQQRLAELGIKVLSLFFIDRVANYVDDDGIIKKLFDEAFEATKGHYPFFKGKAANEVREAYFAKRKKTGSQDEEAFDTEGRNQAERTAEKAAFELIMRKKEQLLSLEEPVSFIFAHSALKEGWDNPNVFQICTLNQTASEMKKRQEIGRGLRLPVNQDGERIFDDQVNVLTVIANESYEGYASALQTEYEEDGLASPPPPSRVGQTTVERNNTIFTNQDFQEFWRRLNTAINYRIHINTEGLIENCRLRLDSMPDNSFIQRIVIERGSFVVTRFTLTLEEVVAEIAQIRIETESTEGPFSKAKTIRSYKVGDDLARRNAESRLRGFEISEINEAGENSSVLFSNDYRLLVGEQLTFDRQSGQVPKAHLADTPIEVFPIFNLIERAAKETGLTRSTINNIFKRLSTHRKESFLTNPEGFANVFILAIKEELSAHIVENIEFKVDLVKPARYDLDDLFPEKKDFAQRELIDGGEVGLYGRVQIDSEVERRFVEAHLSNNDGRVIGYFKFPPAFKVELPKLLGNYNPDWGILFRKDAGDVILKLVRETKGSEDIDRLQFSGEGRKVKAASKYFKELKIDYRMVTDTTRDWWQSGD